MRRKLGVILMVAATTMAGTSQASRQFENLKGALAEWTAQGFQPGFLFFAAGGEEIARHSTPLANRAIGSSECASSVQTAAQSRKVAKDKAPRGRAARAPELAANHGGEGPALSAQRRSEATQFRREIAQVVRDIDGAAVARELEGALARVQVRENMHAWRALDAVDWRELDRNLRVKFERREPPAPLPGKGVGAAVKVGLPETSRDEARQGTKRHERRVVWHFPAIPPPVDDAQPPAWPEPVDSNKGEAGDGSGFDCGDDPRR